MTQQIRSAKPDELFSDYRILEKKGSEDLREGVLMRVGGILQRADTKNANGRIYPKSLWEKLMGNKPLQEKIKTRQMIGVLDHPENGVTALEKVSHIVTGLNLQEGGEVDGTVEILDTPSGKILETFFNAGIRIGISSRGKGSIKQTDEGQIVEDDFDLDTFDFVINPSTPGAYPSIMESISDEQAGNFVSALHSLVERSTDKDLLSEAQSILKLFSEHQEVARRVDTIVQSINNKLTLPDKMPDEKPTGGSPMSAAERLRALSENRDLELVIREEVQRQVQAVESTYTEEVATKDAEISELKEQVEQRQKELSAAEQLIDAFTEKVKSLGGSSEELDEARKQLEAAKQLGEAAIARAKDHEDFKRRYEAAEALLNEMLKRQDDASLKLHVEGKMAELGSVSDEIRETVAEALSAETTVEGVDESFGRFSKLIESGLGNRRVTREPLPGDEPSRKADLKEGDTFKTGGDTESTMTSSLVERVHGKY